MSFSATAVDFVPGSEEHILAATAEPHYHQDQDYVAPGFGFAGFQPEVFVVDEPHLWVLDPSTGDLIPIIPSPCPYVFAVNEDFDAEYAFEYCRGASFWQEQQEVSLYAQGFYFPTITNRNDTAPEVFCPIRCLERFPVSTPACHDIPAQYTQNNRQDFLLGWCERWSHYEEYSVEEMVGNCIHHFNFFNRPVYHKSATKPATTIAILKSSPKHFAVMDAKDLRVPITVSSASRFLDPVRYTGKRAILDTLRGTQLENAVIGHCDKMYSSHGWWRYDTWSQEDDRPLLDPLTTDEYLPGHTIMNGCTEGFPTSREIIAAGTEEKLSIDTARKAAVQSRIARGTAKSKLGLSCVSSDDLEEVPVFPSVRAAQHSQAERQPADTRLDSEPPVAAPTATATAPALLSREEFHRRLAAIPLPSGGDWDDEDDEEPAPRPGALSSERELFNRRLEALGPIGSSSWADDIDEEDEDDSSSPAPAAASEKALQMLTSEAISASSSAQPTIPATSRELAGVTISDSPETSAVEEQPTTTSAAPGFDRQAFERRLEALGSLGSANWADDIDAEEEASSSSSSPRSSVAGDTASSEGTMETALSTSSDPGTRSSATSVCSVEPAEIQCPDSPEQSSVKDEEEVIVGVVIDLDVTSSDGSDAERDTLTRQPVYEDTESAMTEVPAEAAEPDAAHPDVADSEEAQPTEALPEEVRPEETQLEEAELETAEPKEADSEEAQSEVVHPDAADREAAQPEEILLEAESQMPAATPNPISPTPARPALVATHPIVAVIEATETTSGRAWESLRWHVAEAAAFAPGLGASYHQWADFAHISESATPAPLTSSSSSPAPVATGSNNSLETRKTKSKGWLRKGFQKLMKLFSKKE